MLCLCFVKVNCKGCSVGEDLVLWQLQQNAIEEEKQMAVMPRGAETAARKRA